MPVTIEEMSERYRKVRRQVFEDATRPLSKSPSEHRANKEKVRNRIERVCNDANLTLYQRNSVNTARIIWHHIWRKNRYAGFNAAQAHAEIDDIEVIFDDYEIFESRDWDIELKGHEVIRAGRQVKHFLNRSGPFLGKSTIGNKRKLKTIVDVARRLKHFMDSRPASTPPITFVSNGISLKDVWGIHQHLVKEVRCGGHLTALHLMMDMGFSVMKPDTVISQLFHDWKWLDSILPVRLSGKELKRNYTKPWVYKPIIELSRQIVKATSTRDLRSDIGWATKNPLREFDSFMVKFGQEPDPKNGIVRRLHRRNLVRGVSC